MSGFHINHLKTIRVFPSPKGSSCGSCAALAASAQSVAQLQGLDRTFTFSFGMSECLRDLESSRGGNRAPGKSLCSQGIPHHCSKATLYFPTSLTLSLPLTSIPASLLGPLKNVLIQVIFEVKSKMSSQCYFLKIYPCQKILLSIWSGPRSFPRCTGKIERVNHCQRQGCGFWGLLGTFWGPFEVPSNLSWSVVVSYVWLLLQQLSGFIRICLDRF